MLGLPDMPGVIIQRPDRERTQVTSVRTDIPAFVGIAVSGPVCMPVRVTSMRQFEAVFGSYSGSAFLAYSVRAFFENGGRECLAVRAASDDPELGAATASVTVDDVNGNPALLIAAASPGTWGNAVQVVISPAWRAETRAPNPPVEAASLSVETIDGFAAGQLIRLSQPGTPEQWRVLAGVDAANRSLHLVDPDPAARMPGQAPLTGVVPGVALRIERLEYDVAALVGGRLVAVWPGLSLVPTSPRYIGTVLAPQLPDADGMFAAAPASIAVTLPQSPAGNTPAPLAATAGARLALTGGRDGLAGLLPTDFIAALTALETMRDVSILAVPDALIRPVPRLVQPVSVTIEDLCAICPAPAPFSPPLAPAVTEMPPLFGDTAVAQVQAAMIEQCERLRDRVALIDPPWTAARGDAVGYGAAQAWRQRFDSSFGGYYLPWLAVPDPLGRGRSPLRFIPPSGHVAGQLAATDLASGPHHAAANIDLAWAQAPSLTVSPEAHGLLNAAGINVICARNGRPLRILGARTVTSDTNWLFFPVRRLISMLCRALDAATQWAVFEPNSAETRSLLTQSIGIFLESLRRGGALAGATPAEAFRVRCDDSNNPPATRALGQMLIDIAIAPTKPLEFIVLRLSRTENALELAEQGALPIAQAGAA